MHNKDVKFIIYQSLYILVICIIAIKGADINLEEVELKKLMSPGYAYIDTTDKVQVKRDELSKLINFDSTKFMIVSMGSAAPPEKHANREEISYFLRSWKLIIPLYRVGTAGI